MPAIHRILSRVLFVATMMGGLMGLTLGSDYYFPQVADGTNVFSAYAYVSSFLISNPQNTNNSIKLSFSLPNSLPWLIALKCQERPELSGQFTTLTFSLSPAESVRLSTAGSGALVTGWVKIESSMPLEISEVFDVTGTSPASAVRSEAGVLAAPLNTQFSFMASESVDEPAAGTNVATGYALLNPGGAAAQVTATLYSRLGVFLSQRVFTLLPGYQVAQFVSQLFSDVNFATQGRFHGIVRLSSSVNLAMVGLRQTYGTSSTISTMVINPDSLLGFNVIYDVEPNDTPAQAQAIPTLPAMILGTINSPSDGQDTDIFSVALKAGTVLYVIVLTDMIGSPLEDTLQIQDANGNPLITNALPTGLKGPIVSFPVPSDGTYYIAHGAQGSTFGRGSFYRIVLMNR